MTYLLIVKLCSLVAFGCWFIIMLHTIKLGGAARRAQMQHPHEHKYMATWAFWMTLCMIVNASSVHLISKGKIGGASGPLFYTHLPFAIAFLVAIVLMRWFFNGSTHKEVHGIIAHWVLIPSFIMVSLTGPPLVYYA